MVYQMKNKNKKIIIKVFLFQQEQPIVSFLIYLKKITIFFTILNFNFGWAMHNTTSLNFLLYI